MADHKSAIKRIRQNSHRRGENQKKKTRLYSSIKRVRQAIQKGNKSEAQNALNVAIPLLDKASQKKLIHSNTKSRTISRLASQVNALK